MYPACAAVGLAICTATVLCQCILRTGWLVFGKEAITKVFPEDKICTLSDKHNEKCMSFNGGPLFYDEAVRELQRQEMK
jgi:hypothetical protein